MFFFKKKNKKVNFEVYLLSKLHPKAACPKSRKNKINVSLKIKSKKQSFAMNRYKTYLLFFLIRPRFIEKKESNVNV